MADTSILSSLPDASGDASSQNKSSILEGLPDASEPPTSDYSVGQYGHGALGGFNTGLTEMLGAPVDIANWGFRQFGVDIDTPIGGSEWMRRQMPEEMFYDGPPNTLGRVLNRTMKEVGANAPIFGAGLMTAVTRQGKRALERYAAEEAAKQAAASGTKTNALSRTFATTRNAMRHSLDDIAASPMKATALDTGAAAAGGFGASVAQEWLPGSPTAEIAGGLLGGTLFALSPQTRLLAAGGKYAWNKGKSLLPSAQREAGTREAEMALQGEVTDDFRTKLLRGKELNKKAGGALTPAEITGRAGLKAQQQEIEGQAFGAELEGYTARRALNQKAAETFKEQKAPGHGAPSVAVGSAKASVNDYLLNMQRRMDDLAVERREVARRAQTADLKAAGEAMENSIDSARTAASRYMTQRAEELGINNADLAVPFEQVRKDMLDAAKEVEGKTIKRHANATPDALRDLKAKKEGAARPVFANGRWHRPAPTNRQEPMTLRDIKVLRENITDELRVAEKKARAREEPGYGIRALTLRKMLTRLDGFLDGMASGEVAVPNSTKEWAENYKTFRQEYKTGFIDIFEGRGSRSARSIDAAGFGMKPPEQIARDFFKTDAMGGQTTAMEFKGMVGNDPEAMSAMESVILDRLYRRSIIASGEKEGMLNKANFFRFMRDHDKTLDQFPDLKAKLLNTQERNSLLAAEELRVGGIKKEFEQLHFNKILAQYYESDKTARQVIEGALDNPKSMSLLLQHMKGDETAMSALRRGVWDIITEKSTGNIRQAMSVWHETLPLVFTKKQYEDISDLVEFREMAGSIPASGGTAFDIAQTRMIENLSGMSPQVISTRIMNAKTGHAGLRYITVDLLTRFFRHNREKAFDAAMKKALFAPDAVDAMLKVSKLEAKDKGKPFYNDAVDKAVRYVLRYGGASALRTIAIDQDNEGKALKDNRPLEFTIDQGNPVN